MSAIVKLVRKKSFCGSAITCKIEIDGDLVGTVANDDSVTFMVKEGTHSFRCLDWKGKTLKEGTLTVDSDKDILIEIQFNGSTGKLDVFSSAVACKAETKSNNIGGAIAAICITFFLIGVFIYVAVTILIPTPNTSNNSNTQGSVSTQIQYQTIDLQSMLDELGSNALRAQEKYHNKYIEVKGKIDVFDSDGRYITIIPCGASEWNFESVQCYLTDPSHKTFLLEKNIGDEIIIRGKVTSVGEVLGYSIDIVSISG